MRKQGGGKRERHRRRQRDLEDGQEDRDTEIRERQIHGGRLEDIKA